MGSREQRSRWSVIELRSWRCASSSRPTEKERTCPGFRSPKASSQPRSRRSPDREGIGCVESNTNTASYGIRPGGGVIGLHYQDEGELAAALLSLARRCQELNARLCFLGSKAVCEDTRKAVRNLDPSALLTFRPL